MIDPSVIQHECRLGDCLGPEGLALLPDKSVDHAICDPPYEAEAHTVRHLDFAPITEETRAAIAREMVRVSRGWVIAFCQAEAIFGWRRCLMAAGARWRRSMIWVKPDGQPCLVGDRPGMGYESMAAAWAGTGRSAWNGGGRTGVYTYPKSTANGNEHPTQKPLALMEALVRDFTIPGDLVCDPFSGSCTTLVAAKRLGRRAIGWERDPRYYEIGRKRLDAAREQLGLWRGAA